MVGGLLTCFYSFNIFLRGHLGVQGGGLWLENMISSYITHDHTASLLMRSTHLNRKSYRCYKKSQWLLRDLAESDRGWHPMMTTQGAHELSEDSRRRDRCCLMPEEAGGEEYTINSRSQVWESPFFQRPQAWFCQPSGRPEITWNHAEIERLQNFPQNYSAWLNSNNTNTLHVENSLHNWKSVKKMKICNVLTITG